MESAVIHLLQTHLWSEDIAIGFFHMWQAQSSFSVHYFESFFFFFLTKEPLDISRTLEAAQNLRPQRDPWHGKGN